MLELLGNQSSVLDSLFAQVTRGDGFFYHNGKLLLVILLYFAWIATIIWADRDAIMAGMPREKWNLLFIGCFAVGLLSVWLIPMFGLALIVMMALFLAPTLMYILQRNEKV